MNLTDKQKRFCEEYVVDWNATQAAIRAGYATKRASEQGYQLLQNTTVSEYIEEIQKDLKKLCGVSASMLVNELKAIAMGSLADIVDDQGRMIPFSEMSREQKAIVSDVQMYIKEESSNDPDSETEHYTVTTTAKAKANDKIKAIQELSKIFGFYAAEKKEIAIDNTNNQTPSEKQEEIDNLIQDLADRRSNTKPNK